MLMEVKNQFRVTFLSIKFSLMRELLNKATFISNIFFMILNNASFIIQWLILFSLKDSIGGYHLKEVLLLWGLAASTYGVSHFLFRSTYFLSDTINNGKLDSFLVMPKNVLISTITSSIDVSALGDLLYGIIMIFVYGFSIKTFLLFIIFSITGGLILTSFAVILGSLSFYFSKSDIISDTGNNLITSFATYPDGIFKGLAKIMLFTIIPVGISTYIPLKILTEFNLILFLIVILATIIFIALAFVIFYKGLEKYSSSNLMIARI